MLGGYKAPCTHTPASGATRPVATAHTRSWVYGQLLALSVQENLLHFLQQSPH